ncbi:hypothetical protein J7E87_14670 [Streptomyces sp. ISL-1]|uniref:hypothetical protein n=1 Tax=Streptomyces sp. ISL-1 TaxID=2817657 RepID=UPI001BE68CA4|nr:hypothetical protein [Streptomyces sp. ISL-1]MBT2390638.1 hypothetical protein [Streptomyces sp. ISL-1]
MRSRPLMRWGRPAGALGGIGLAQVAVHLTYASTAGHALIDRAPTDGGSPGKRC